MNVSDLPALNATLNGVAGCFLVGGYVCIRRGLRDAHRACMIAAFAASALFLVSYVVYHANAGSKPFPGTGVARPVYFAILITHVVLAAVILPMAIVTLARALARALRSPRPHRPLDAAALALRVGDRRRDLLDAVPDEVVGGAGARD